MPEKDHQGKGSVLNEDRVEKDTTRPLENKQDDSKKDTGGKVNDILKDK